MKIIVHNVLVYQCLCYHCTSVFQFEEKEAKWDYGDYTSKTCVSIKCPACNTPLYIAQDKLEKVILHVTNEENLK